MVILVTLIVAGIATLANKTVTAGTLSNVTVSSLSTFTGAIDANGNLDVDGETELDNLNVMVYRHLLIEQTLTIVLMLLPI